MLEENLSTVILKLKIIFLEKKCLRNNVRLNKDDSFDECQLTSILGQMTFKQYNKAGNEAETEKNSNVYKPCAAMKETFPWWFCKEIGGRNR